MFLCYGSIAFLSWLVTEELKELDENKQKAVKENKLAVEMAERRAKRAAARKVKK